MNTAESLQIQRLALSGEGDFCIDWTITPPQQWLLYGATAQLRRQLLRCLAGVMPAEAVKMPARWGEGRPNQLAVAWVVAGGGLISAWDLYENLALPLRYHRLCEEHEIEARIQRLWQALALPQARLAQGCAGLSAHESQWFGVLRALLTEPRLLLVDEGIERLREPWWQRLLSWLPEQGIGLVVSGAEVPSGQQWQGEKAHLAQGRLQLDADVEAEGDGQ